MTVKDVNFMHIEIVHPDPEAAAKFMIEVFGAEPCESVIEAGIAAGCQTSCKHVKMGGVVFQFIAPGGIMPDSWKNTMESNGPCVHNICLITDNVNELSKDILSRGAKLIQDITAVGFPINILNPEAGDLKGDGSQIDATEQCGLRFELLSDSMLPYWPVTTKDNFK